MALSERTPQTMRAEAGRRAAFSFAMMTILAAAACIFIAGAESSRGVRDVVLVMDCSVDPAAPSCKRPSFMDMINGIGQRAQSNAIRQKKIKQELLKQEKASMQKLAARQALQQMHKKAAGEDKAAAGGNTNGKKQMEATSIPRKSLIYSGLDIGSRKAVDSEMSVLMKKGGAQAVEKKVSQIREQILADSGKMFGFGKKAGYLPPPPSGAFK